MADGPWTKYETKSPPVPSEGNIIADYGRAAAQGLTFGFADEMEAAVRSALDSGADYTDVVKEVRNKINEFRDRSPGSAYGTEIAASILPTIAAQFIPGAGQALGAARATQLGRLAQTALKGPVRKAAVTSGGQGALYGLGTGEGGPGGRLESAALTGGLSAVGGAAMQKVAPHITSKAKELLRSGVPLTPGQSVRGSGLLGDAIATIEEKAASTIPFVGDAIRGAFDRARAGFNRASVNEALKPLGVLAPKGKEGTDLISYGERTLNIAYDKALKNMAIRDQDPLFNAALKISEELNKDIADDFLDRSQRIIFDRFDDAGGALRGQALKKVQSRLRKELKRLRTSGYNNETDARKADAIQDLWSVFTAELAKQNPRYAKQLNNVDRAYGNFEIIRKASMRRKQEESWTPVDVLGEAAKADPTARKSQFSSGRARMQRGARVAQDVIGRSIPDSGTAGRLEATKLLTGGGLAGGIYADPIIGAPLALGTMAAYSKAGVPIARNVLGMGGEVMRRAVPAGAAAISQGEMAVNVRRALAKALENR